jgi:MmoB/DmpM family
MTMASLRDTATGVGPVLSKGRRADAVIAAIRELNERAEIVDRGAYLRVQVPTRCTVTRQAIEKHAGEPFVFPSDLEMIMPSFKGRLSLTEDIAEWYYGDGGGG